MGRGDKKSKKGKRWRGSYGVARNRNTIKAKIKRSSSKKVGGAESGPVKARRVVKKKAEA